MLRSWCYPLNFLNLPRTKQSSEVFFFTNILDSWIFVHIFALTTTNTNITHAHTQHCTQIQVLYRHVRVCVCAWRENYIKCLRKTLQKWHVLGEILCFLLCLEDITILILITLMIITRFDVWSLQFNNYDSVSIETLILLMMFHLRNIVLKRDFVLFS